MQTIIIGLDAFDPIIFESLYEAGRLPNLRHYVSEGNYCHFQVANPPQSEVSWTSIATAAVPPLTPLAQPGPEAVELENLTNRFVTDQRFQLQTELACVQNQVTAAGGSFVPVSAYRSTGYQQHLREIRDSQRALDTLETQECAYLKQEVQREFSQHGLLSTQRPAVNSLHEQGLAFDMRVNGLSDIQIDIAAATCGLYRFDPISDPNHFHRP